MSASTAAIVNNVTSDVAEGVKLEAIDATKATVLASVVGNYISSGEQMLREVYVITRYGTHEDAKFYFDGTNFFRGQVQTDAWQEITQCGDWGTSCKSAVMEHHRAEAPPVWPVGMQVLTAQEARSYVLENAGARPSQRDAVDERLISTLSFKDAPMAWIDCVDCDNTQCVAGGDPRQCCSGLGTGSCRAAPGGWPKDEPTQRALDIPSDPMELRPSGYTALEEYLHSLSAVVEARDIPAPSSLRVGP
jgi:hypothetical protein